MNDKQEKVGLFRVVLSVIAAMFGVQSEKSRERDFQHGRPVAYVIVGLIMTVLFVLTVWGIVTLVMNLAGVK